MKALTIILTISFAILISACTPKVGSEAWCESMKNTPKGEWSVNEAGDYAKHCVFK